MKFVVVCYCRTYYKTVRAGERRIVEDMCCKLGYDEPRLVRTSLTTTRRWTRRKRIV